MKKNTYKDKSLNQPKTFNYNPYKLPDSEEQIREPYVMPVANNYAHGFAHIRVNADKSYSIKNFRIYDGKLL